MLTTGDIDSLIQEYGSIVLDGGLATELERRGYDLNHHLWSARLLLEDPSAIKAVQKSFLEAGSMCIATASYQASVPGLVAAGLSEAQSESLLLQSVRDTKAAIAEFSIEHNISDTRIVAASLGSYGAYLADGSEYRGKFGVAKRELYEFHRQRLDLISQASPDLLAFETIPCQTEVEAILAVMEESSIPAWVSFSCKDGHTMSDGTAISECASMLSDSPAIFAIGVNCVAPDHVASQIHQIRIGAPNKQVVVYPNSGQTYDIRTRSWLGESDAVNFAELAIAWHKQGATLIGGCCQTGPEHIREIKAAIQRN